MKSAIEIISEALAQYGGKQTRTSSHIMIQCPFHEDGSPSCGVFMGEGMSIPLGSFNCFGCGTHGGWNKLAQQCKFPVIKEWNTKFSSTMKNTDLKAEYATISELTDSMKLPYTEWPDEVEWRGFSGSIIKKVGGIMVEDRYLNTIAAFFPVYIGDSLKGGVKAAFKKEKNSLPYITTKGEWVMKYGLFPYNAVKKMKKDFVVLVEGPRDALRLYSNGIPALAILGSKNFNESKALMLSSLCPELVIALPDNDKAGKDMKKLVKHHMNQYCHTVSVALPEGVNDPEKMSKEDIKNFKNIICNI